VTLRHRDRLDETQRELREVPGVTVLLYDQTCAAEKRRRRKRGLYPDPPRRVVINAAVCEGCGDCSEVSNCLSVVPRETALGRKRTIDQSSCNKDYSCLKGFCPSFVTVEGGALRRAGGGGEGAGAIEALAASLPAASPAPLDPTYGILVTGVGGTGVVTIGALLGMAAHIEGKGCSVLDMTGLAQKGGAVISHIRIAERPEEIHAVRLSAGGADLVIGCDLVVSSAFDSLSKIHRGRAHAIINSHQTITGDFTRDPDLAFPARRMRTLIETATGAERVDFLDATAAATALLGDSIATNLFMVGYALQKGLLPLSGEALDRAIELNGVAVELNRRALTWGRLAAHDPAAVAERARPGEAAAAEPAAPRSTEELVAQRRAHLVDYQNEALARCFEGRVAAAQAVETERAPGCHGLVEAVARGYFKLLAYKDEYEVARLLSAPAFAAEIAARFDGPYRLNYHLAPPLIAKRDRTSGHLIKRRFGPWLGGVLKPVAALKVLRGGPLDPFGRSAERRQERQLIGDYERLTDELFAKLTAANHAIAVELAALPEAIRGFGHVKEANLALAEAREAELLARFRDPGSEPGDSARHAAE
jgi:indolepyruvate ferredoxin oxidoreductase